MQIKNPSRLLPLQFGKQTKFRKLSWQDFKGKIDQSMPWSAHIYWFIDYKITNVQKKKLSATLFIHKNSWVRPQRRSEHLLNHQQGHYLIGALCLLQFLRRIDKKRQQSLKLTLKNFQDLVLQTFDRTMKEYLQIQKKYDNQTQHRMNYKKQQEWDSFIYQRLSYYQSIYDKKMQRFVKLSDKNNNININSPEKKR